eukprot:298189-Pyramimonas_sp.AAC.1
MAACHTLLPPPRGFSHQESRTFGNNIVELDCHCRIFSMASSALSDLPALVSSDFAQAFRSHGHERIPEPLKLFVVTLYTDALCYGAFASPMAFLFFQGRGVIQGRPASGAQLAVATGGFYQGTDV